MSGTHITHQSRPSLNNRSSPSPAASAGEGRGEGARHSALPTRKFHQVFLHHRPTHQHHQTRIYEKRSALMGRKLHSFAKPKLFGYAKSNRRPLTPSEKKLWNCIRKNQVNGLKFRRQHPVGYFILDFYCYERKLAIEVDGGYHTEQHQRRYDERRTQLLAELGIRVLRFTNEQIHENLGMVIHEIEKLLR